jgi:hypothetical protein
MEFGQCIAGCSMVSAPGDCSNVIFPDSPNLHPPSDFNHNVCCPSSSSSSSAGFMGMVQNLRIASPVSQNCIVFEQTNYSDDLCTIEENLELICGSKDTTLTGCFPKLDSDVGSYMIQAYSPETPCNCDEPIN